MVDMTLIKSDDWNCCGNWGVI